MDGLREMEGGQGWHGSGEDGMSNPAPVPSLRPFSAGEEAVTGGEEEANESNSPQEDRNDGDSSRDTVDQDEEDDEEMEELIVAVTGVEGIDDDDEGADNEGGEPRVSEDDQKTYEALTKTIIDRLPRSGVAELVGKSVKDGWLAQRDHMKGVVVKVLEVEAVCSAIRRWWDFLVALLVENSKKPFSSALALEYEKARRKKRFDAQREFSHEPTIRIAAIKSGLEERRVTHALTSVFYAIDQGVDKTITQKLSEAHLVNVTYPAGDIDLDVHQRRLVYNIGGWLLSSALSRVKRQPRLGRAFLPFVNSHKFKSAKDFGSANPEFQGLEFEVDQRNAQYEGKGLIFPTAEFYLFVRALEVGYKSAMLNPALLATYLGDLPAEVRRVVSTADPVKAAWARCVGLVKDPHLGAAGREGCVKQCDELFDFMMTKWHNCRFFFFTKVLTSLKKTLKNRKAQMALRDHLKAGVGGGQVGGRAPAPRAAKSKEPKVYTTEQRARQLQLNEIIGVDAWRSLTCDHLKEYIRECGGTVPNPPLKAELQKALRKLAPRAGVDSDPSVAALRPSIIVPDNWYG